MPLLNLSTRRLAEGLREFLEGADQAKHDQKALRKELSIAPQEENGWADASDRP